MNNLTETIPHFREVWPEAEFGTSGMSVEEEMDSVRDILLNPAAGQLTHIKAFFNPLQSIL